VRVFVVRLLSRFRPSRLGRHRQRRGFALLDGVAQDLRYALRTCRRSPGFTLVAVLTLAVGIGANTAIFSLVDAVLLTPLPYPDPSRLVLFMTTAPEGAYHYASEAKFNAWRSLTSTFDDIAAFDFKWVNIPTEDHFERVTVGDVSADFFPLFGARLQAGRTFSAAEDEPNGDRVAVISDAFWARRFQRRNAIGQTLRLKGQSYTIVGVLQSTFEGAIITNDHDTGPDVYLPLQIDPASTDLAASLVVGGRVRSSVSLAEAQARVAATTAALRRRFPASVRQGDGATVQPYQTLLRRNDRDALLVLSGAVGLVLLIACANLANLLLARGAARTQEIAMRAALGATRRRIVQQLLTESVLLAAIGGGAGFAIGLVAIDAVVAVTGPTITRIGLTGHGVPIDARVLVFTSGIAVGAVLVFGLLPALISSRVDLSRRLSDAESTRGSGRSNRRLGGLLTAGEIGIAVVLLVGAALFIQTFANLGRVRLGFDTHDVLTLQVTLDAQNLRTAENTRSIRNAQQRLRAIPGVIDATASCCVPFDSDYGATLRYVIEGRPLDGPYHGMGAWRPVAPDYFETLRIPLLRGRTFTDRDSLDAPRVVIVDQAMADKWWPHGDALGQRLTLGKGIGGAWEEPPREIVGIVANVRDAALDREPQPANYVPIAQLTDGVSAVILTQLTWLVRTQADPEALRPRIEQELRRASGGMPVTSVGQVDALIRRSTARARFRMWLMGTFAVIALLLAAIGVYGVMAYAVRQRTREIGIRIAIGAEPREVTRMVVMNSLRYSLAGLVAGLGCAVWLTRLLTTFLFGITPWDPVAFSSAVIVLALVAAVAAWIPARHAARIDPLIALRAD
jgi:putative ABC transport system permease protein